MIDWIITTIIGTVKLCHAGRHSVVLTVWFNTVWRPLINVLKRSILKMINIKHLRQPPLSLYWIIRSLGTWTPAWPTGRPSRGLLLRTGSCPSGEPSTGLGNRSVLLVNYSSVSQLVGRDPKVGHGLVLNGSRSVGEKKPNVNNYYNFFNMCKITWRK